MPFRPIAVVQTIRLLTSSKVADDSIANELAMLSINPIRLCQYVGMPAAEAPRTSNGEPATYKIRSGVVPI